MSDPVAPLVKALTDSAPPPGTPVLVAVSGGADSNALLLSLLESGLELGVCVAHFDHGLRPDSTRDASQVLELCERLGVKSYFKRWRGKLSGEAAAREARYRFLRRLCADEGYQRIALGHTIEDQVETLLVNLSRGAGLDGLAGMSVDDGELWRPFLDLHHRELRTYLRSRDAGWIEDPTNRDKALSRNLIRHQILPLLAQVNPEVINNIARASRILSRQRDYLRGRGGEIAEEAYLDQGPWGRVYSINVLAKEHEALLFEALRSIWATAVGWRGYLTSGHLVEMVELVKGRHNQGAVDLPRRLRLRRSWHRLCLGPRRIPAPPRPLTLEAPGRWQWGRYDVILGSGSAPSPLGHLPLSDSDLPLTLRSRIDGDALRLSGVGTKKLKKILSENRLPAWEREHLPVVADDEGPLWIPGVARDERAPTDGDYKLVLSDRSAPRPAVETEPEARL